MYIHLKKKKKLKWDTYRGVCVKVCRRGYPDFSIPGKGVDFADPWRGGDVNFYQDR